MVRRPLVLSLLVLAIGSAALFPLWTRPGIVYSKNSDEIALSAGLQSLARRSLTEDRRWPVWDPASNSGTPAHANPVAMYSFPLQWFYLLLPIDLAAKLFFLSNVLLAGLAMLAFSRRRLESPGAAVFCAVAYMLSYRCFAMIDAGWSGPLAMYALTPLLAWAADRILERPDPARAAAFAVVLALSAMQAFTQTFYYAVLGLVACVVWLLPGIPRERRIRIALAFLGGGSIALLLAAPELLPRAQFAALSTRTTRSYLFFLDHAPGWSDLATLLSPRDAGGMRREYWENNFYFGWWLYPLAAWGCWKNRAKSRLPLAAFALCLILCFDSPLLALLFRALPGFALFRRTTRVLLLAQFIIVLLAGIGVDELLKKMRRPQALAAAAFLCLLPLADWGARAIPRLETKPLAEAFPEPPFFDLLRSSPANGRVAIVGRTALSYGTAAYLGLDMINGYQPLNLKDYGEYFSVLQNGDLRHLPRAPIVWNDLTAIAKPGMLRALDARSIVADRALPLESIGYELVGHLDNVPEFAFYRGLIRTPFYLWRDRRPLGPAYFAASVAPVKDEAESLAGLAASTSPLDARVFDWPGQRLDFTGGTVRMIRRGLSIDEYEIDSRGSNFLILSQVWYPGWRAELDGKESPLYRTNHALIGLVVPAGRHALKLEMTSPALRLGIILCAVGLAAVLLVILSPRFRT